MRFVAIAAVAAGAIVASGSTSAMAAATAPSCIARNVKTFNVVELVNNCGTPMNVKVIWKYAPDSACLPMAIGQKRTVAEYRSPLVEYDKTVTC
ncbi:hypothetical protein AB0B89_07620 [Sphaerisporangium sp. NPDC049002]|uniref:hypothetical protein n=1 Tax=Sphaerisporangium sp. NPDC049002 TaxID=3155392 RepID=UPI0033CEA7D7